MILAHCFIFLYRIYPELSKINELKLIDRFAFFNGFYSMTLPALAGVMFYEKIKIHLRGSTLVNIHIPKMLKPLGYLFFFESLKNSIIYGWVSFFRWDVLHFISISMILLLFIIIKYGVHAIAKVNLVFFLSICSLFIFNIQFLLFKQYESIIELNYFLSSLVILFLYFVVLNHIMQARKIVATAILLSMCLILFFQKDNLELKTIVYHLPVSIFIQLGQNGGHLWPLFPWISLVFLGFNLSRFLEKFKFKNKSLIAICLLLQLPLYYIFFFKLELYQINLSKKDFFNSLIFQPNISTFLILHYFFIVATMTFNFFENNFKVPTKVILKVNEYILPIYFVHLFVAWNIINPLAQLFTLNYLKWIYPIVVMFLTYCFMQVFLLASNKTIWFRLKRIDRG